MRLWRIFRRRRPLPLGTVAGNPSALDDVLAEGPLLDPQSGTPMVGLYALEQEAAAHADLARDVSSAFDDLEEAEKKRRDALGSPEADG